MWCPLYNVLIHTGWSYYLYWRLTWQRYLINYVLAWSTLQWKSRDQFWRLLQWLRILRVPSGQCLPQLELNLLLLDLSLFWPPWDICKRTGAEVYCLMKYHRTHHHHFYVCVAIALYSNNNSETELNFRLIVIDMDIFEPNNLRKTGREYFTYIYHQDSHRVHFLGWLFCK